MAASDQDQQRKDRIIHHLNKDHPESLSLYLQHYKKLSATEAAKPLVTNITLDGLTISSRGNAYGIVFSPPLKSWADARERTVDMDREARAGLGISSIKITEYEPPQSPIHVILFALCLLTLVVNIVPSIFSKGTWVYDTLLPWFPGGPERFLWVAKVSALPMQLAHFGEAYLLHRRLTKHGVQTGSSLWWKWIVDCSLEGFGCFQRIDAQVKRKTLEAANTKH